MLSFCEDSLEEAENAENNKNEIISNFDIITDPALLI
jgi:hypothetical protein